jgi:hypothetical protein
LNWKAIWWLLFFNLVTIICSAHLRLSHRDKKYFYSILGRSLTLLHIYEDKLLVLLTITRMKFTLPGFGFFLLATYLPVSQYGETYFEPVSFEYGEILNSLSWYVVFAKIKPNIFHYQFLLKLSDWKAYLLFLSFTVFQCISCS